LERARILYGLRHGVSAPSQGQGTPSLAWLCLQQLASDPDLLTDTTVDTIGGDLAQQLLDLLVSQGKLDNCVLERFSQSALWRLKLASYPGVVNEFCGKLTAGGNLTVVDLSCTLVRFLPPKALSLAKLWSAAVIYQALASATVSESTDSTSSTILLRDAGAFEANRYPVCTSDVDQRFRSAPHGWQARDSRQHAFSTSENLRRSMMASCRCSRVTSTSTP
jgi:hypothetical protein